MAGALDIGGIRGQSGVYGQSVDQSTGDVKLQEISKSQLKQQIGVRSDTTLAKWQAAGLIPKGMIKPSPTGRGTTAYFPKEVADVGRRIKRLTREGLTLKQVRGVLEAQDAEVSLPPQRRSKNSPSKKASMVDLGPRRIWIADRASKESKKVARYVRDTRAPHLIDDGLIEEAARLAREGHSPVLVIGLDESFVIADYRAGNFFAAYPAAEAVLMIPLRELFLVELENAKRLYSPVEKVNQSDITIEANGTRTVSSQKMLDTGEDGQGGFLRCIDLD